MASYVILLYWKAVKQITYMTYSAVGLGFNKRRITTTQIRIYIQYRTYCAEQNSNWMDTNAKHQ